MKIIKLLALILFFSCNLASAQDTLYIYRAGIVVTKLAVSEIDSISFYNSQSTPVPESVTDIDGYVYHTVKIGNQIWMVEDLKTTKYSNGDLIGTSSPIRKDLTYEDSPKYQWAYDDNNSNVLKYGRLYTWYAATDSRKIAPKGWHVASDNEWKTLQNYLIANGYNYDGTKTENKIAKSLSATSLWNTCLIEGAIGTDLTKNNSSGFTAVPAGYRGVDGTFYILNWVSDHWTSTEDSSDFARMYALGYTSPDLGYYSKNKKYGISVRCVKDTLSLPVLITTTVSDITDVSALSGGHITSDGGSTITARGVCWSTSVMPTILNTKTTENNDSVLFTSTLTGLTGDTTYYVRAYATNSKGTAYGEQVSFKTLKPVILSVTDVDGNLYHTIKIGSQTWMVENLKTKRYCNGDLIETTNPITKDISSEMAPNYQWAYDGNESNVSVYGRLYTWYAVTDSRKLAPAGWHVATDAEWTTLQNYLTENGLNYDGTTTGNKIAKSLSSTTLWTPSSNEGAIGNDLTKNNASGFTSVPGGYHGIDGQFYWLNSGSEYWTSTESTPTTSSHRVLGYSTSNIGFSNSNNNYGLSVRCVKDTVTSDTISIPVIITTPVSAITNSTAISGGIITSDGGSSISDRGVCFSTSALPTILNRKTTENIDSAKFISKLTGLAGDSIYYVRAYATNSIGTAYGEQVSFKTLYPDTLTVTDVDGNVYSTVKIGNQIWMAENLKTTRLNDSTSIPNVADPTIWASMTTLACCWYNNDSITYNSTLGKMYNWYTVETGKLAPKGWHVATDNEWETLTSFLGVDVAGGKLKETGLLHWLAPNTGATNETNFSALPGGNRGQDKGTFGEQGTGSFWWTSTVLDDTYSRFRSVGYISSGVGKSGSGKDNGLYVRCIKD